MANNSYLVHYNHNHDELGRFARSIGSAASSVGSALTGKKKKAPPSADIKSKQGGSKSDNTKLTKSGREYLLNKGSLSEITANKDRLSNKELEFALNRVEKDMKDRVDLEKRIADLNAPTEKTTVQKGTEVVNQAIKTGKSLTDYAPQAMAVWNVMAGIHNASAAADDKWFTFGKDGRPQSNGPAPDIYDLITKGSASDILANKDRFTLDQLKEAASRREQLAKIEDYTGKDIVDPKSKMTKEDLISKGSYDDIKKYSDKLTPNEVNTALQNLRDREASNAALEKYRQEHIPVTTYNQTMGTNSGAVKPSKPSTAERLQTVKGKTEEKIYKEKLKAWENQALREAKEARREQKEYDKKIKKQRKQEEKDRKKQEKEAQKRASQERTQVVKNFVDSFNGTPVEGEPVDIEDWRNKKY